MPRPNRVTPFGTLIAVPERGAFMGNRGRLHDASGSLTRRRWTTKAWICCLLAFKGRRRPLMQLGRYTELFFLDEATALAAGHRPCAECRRADFERFRAHWASGNGLAALPRAGEMDARLHAERLQAPYIAEVVALPDGAMVELPERPGTAWLLAGGRLHAWTPGGYAESVPIPEGSARVLTPRSTVAALAAGYRPHTALPPA
ncbi:MAG TPA: hypothetical protein VD978_34265 [Azospirillum sp.]|nr:hypothetical protein [Azospirillum sp.]